MTAEIVIMNKDGIALAADSAVTVNGVNTTKIFPSANKLFALSKMHPVGIMIYQNTEFMEMPWETIIKVYREELGNKKFDTLHEYADSFLGFLIGEGTERKLFPIDVQEAYMYGCVQGHFWYLKKLILEEIESIKNTSEGKIDSEIVEELISRIIHEEYEIWHNAKNHPYVPKDYNKKIISEYGEKIDSFIEEVFEQSPLSPESLNKLRVIASYLFSKFPEDRVSIRYTGVVIAGFGDKEYFPSMIEYRLESIFMDTLKYKINTINKVDSNNRSSIYPCAQREMVDAFMSGVDPNYHNTVMENIAYVLEKYTNIFEDILEKHNVGDQQDIEEYLETSKNNIISEFGLKLFKYQQQFHINPVTKIVAILPKDELALMAETLVNLTSFKRKISEDAETVGGPIDVAIISKGDGFIWVKRKHYFEQELNSQFIIKRYKEAFNEK